MLSILTFVIEDNSVTSELLSSKLNQHAGMTVKKFSSIEEAMKENTLKPNYILLDNFLEGATGIDSIPRFKEIFPETKIILLSNQSNDEFTQKAIKKGASACFKKDGNGIMSALRLITLSA